MTERPTRDEIKAFAEHVAGSATRYLAVLSQKNLPQWKMRRIARELSRRMRITQRTGKLA